MQPPKMDPALQKWVEARRRHHLSHAHVQMARELGINPASLGGMDNRRQERWKAPLPDYLEHLYRKRFGLSRPDRVIPLEDLARERARKKAARREAKAERRAAEARSTAGEPSASPPPCTDPTGPAPDAADAKARERGGETPGERGSGSRG